MKKLLALSLCVLMALSVCSFGYAIDDEVYPLASKPTLTVWLPFDGDITLYGFSSQADTPGFKAWQEATGVTIELVEPTDNTALNLMLASGDLPDMIRADKSFYSKGIAEMLNDGVTTDLTDNLAKWAPNYNAFLQSNEDIFRSAAIDVEGDLRIVAFSGNFYPVDSPFRNYEGLIARKDFMDALGIESITTGDQFYDFLSRCKAELGIEIPFIAQNSMMRQMWNVGIATSISGLISAGGYQVDGVYHYGAYEPEFKGTLEYMKKLYDDGLMDPNFAVTDNATAVANITNGTSAVILSYVSRFMVIDSAKQDDSVKLNAIPSLVANEGDRAKMCYAVRITSDSFWCFITEECKDVESAMRFFDYLYTDAGKDLANYGIEGVTYTRDENGEVQMTEFVTNNPDGYAIDPILRSYGLVNWSCIHRREFSEKRFPMTEQRNACDIWSDNDYNDYLVNYYSIPAELQEEYARLWTDIDTYLNESIANFIIGTEPLDNFDAYLQTLQSMGMDRAIEIMQLAIDPFYGA